jgi:hypothetical protein
MKGVRLVFYLSILCVALVVILTWPGFYERHRLRSMLLDSAEINSYRELMGAATAEYFSYEAFKDTYANKVFKIDPPKVSSSYIYWAREGLPYYWVLIIRQNDTNLPPDVKIQTGW